MTRTWKLEDAKTHLSQLIRDAEKEPQVITRHGKPVAVVSAVAPPATQPEQAHSALDALRGDFDFSDMPDEDLFARDRSSDLRELEW
ncbi:type II toxin-antitoxin system Phd/YefM family antitoxin (plasmid) [Deinococcus psychrotolerans]|uniref:Antitoxin n=1 Tax=Deinococcus psychrotolerans TaxID=2489213 RepID=A0A3G8YVE2_9DEIO|nr:type II toxin-antitoxin system prevent-host-death family antitoxin [Deinococcus psychrotolerans]AZI45166.1 type II toxin-antitoxin system Phd/YefM family antitoxin [Deinococcus psychrotolerans]